MFHDTDAKGLSLLTAILSFIGMSVVGQRYPAIFQYNRPAIMAGEYWRIVTCHFVHTGWEHLFLNSIGVLLLFVLFFRLYSLLVWFAGVLCCMVGISLSFLLLCPTLVWYMGLSGVLHGVLLMGLIGEIKSGNRFYFFGLLAIFGKLTMEYSAGPADLASQFGKAVVISPAHYSGAITGGVTACLIIFIQKLLTGRPTRPTNGSMI